MGVVKCLIDRFDSNESLNYQNASPLSLKEDFFSQVSTIQLFLHTVLSPFSSDEYNVLKILKSHASQT